MMMSSQQAQTVLLSLLKLHRLQVSLQQHDCLMYLSHPYITRPACCGDDQDLPLELNRPSSQS
jgi:hypothetical protein